MYPRAMIAFVLSICAGCLGPEPLARRGDEYQNIRAVAQHMAESAIEVVTFTGGGTGFAVSKIGDYTYIVTCEHVIVGYPVVTVRLRDGDKMISAPAIVVYADKAMDLALLKTSQAFPLFPLMSSADYGRLETGDLVLAGGFPGSVVPPCLVTIGSIRETDFSEDPSWLHHSCSGWFGFSGGPVVSGATGEIVGVTARIFGDENGANSALMLAVPVYYVHRFLEVAYSKV